MRVEVAEDSFDAPEPSFWRSLCADASSSSSLTLRIVPLRPSRFSIPWFRLRLECVDSEAQRAVWFWIPRDRLLFQCQARTDLYIPTAALKLRTHPTRSRVERVRRALQTLVDLEAIALPLVRLERLLLARRLARQLNVLSSAIIEAELERRADVFAREIHAHCEYERARESFGASSLTRPVSPSPRASFSKAVVEPDREVSRLKRDLALVQERIEQTERALKEIRPRSAG